MEIVDDPKWAPEKQYWGGFSFLDPIGTRYYLPPLLIRASRDGPCDNLFSALAPGKSDSADSFGWFRDHFSAFTTRQRRCVAAFVRLQVDRRDDPAWKNDAIVQFFEWPEIYERYWKQFDK
ncbi:MAG: hypothetical protein KF805_13965 [Phycisphaeraceae bacterium]|nr:hypothetical protein [Phycisphaeraceae bacterium]